MFNVTIGRLTRSTTTDYVFACKVPEPEVPTFGAFVKAPSQRGQADVLGLIYNIAFTDDMLVRQLAAAENLPDEMVQDQRQNRQVPIEVSVLSIGYRTGDTYIYALPPQPPVTLDRISPCDSAEICSFTQRLDFLRLILNSPVPMMDELVATAILAAAACRPVEERERFLREAGRELARLLGRDLARLENLLRRIKP
ncbi:MAG: hypothetical protein HYZ49_20385 [Chloroflexi bacterium]|nr:hypothetical protein [Chloroflexota bacterium]